MVHHCANVSLSPRAWSQRDSYHAPQPIAFRVLGAEGPCSGWRKQPLMPRSLEPRHGEEVSGNRPLVSYPKGQSFQGPVEHLLCLQGALQASTASTAVHDPHLQGCSPASPTPGLPSHLASKFMLTVLLWPVHCLSNFCLMSSVFAPH